MQLSVFFPQLLLLGDSIVQDSVQTPSGIIPQLQNLYLGKLDVVNRGFDGYTTFDAAQIAEPVFNGLGEAPVEWTVIVLGTDELARHKDLTVLFSSMDLVDVVATAVQRSRNVVLVGPGIVNEDDALGTNYNFYTFSEYARQIAELYNVPFIDLWGVFRTFLGEDPTLYGELAGGISALGPLDNAASNATFANSVDGSPFNISLPLGLTNTSSGASPNSSSSASPAQCTFSDANYTAGLNGTNGTNCTTYSYRYIGEKGNPDNFLLDLLLTNGSHYTDLAYELWLEALVSVLDVTTPASVLPDYQGINSTKVLPAAIAADYVAAAAETGTVFLDNSRAYANLTQLF